MEKIKSEILRYYLLILTHRDGDINVLLNEGVSLLDISLEMRKMAKNKLISDIEGYLKLTTDGKEEAKRIRKKYNLSNIESFIVPDLYYRVDKIGLDEVYLP